MEPTNGVDTDHACVLTSDRWRAMAKVDKVEVIVEQKRPNQSEVLEIGETVPKHALLRYAAIGSKVRGILTCGRER